jgi:hypothetical protein
MLPNAALVARFSDLMAAWLLTYAVHSTLLLAAAWLLTSRKRMSDGVRDVLWKSALIGGIVTASVQTATAHEPLGGQLRLSPRTAPSAPAMRLTIRDIGTATAPRLFVLQPKGTRWPAALVVAWMTIGGLGLLWLTLGHARTLRALETRTSLDDYAIGGLSRDV